MLRNDPLAILGNATCKSGEFLLQLWPILFCKKQAIEIARCFARKLDKQLKLACHFNRFAPRKTVGIKGGIEMQKTRKSRSLVLMSLTYMVCIVILSISTVASAAVPADQMKKVEFIHKSVYSDLIHLNDAESLQWDVDGGRETSSGMERVWGWSTCKDGQ